jgi:glyoxylase-like metal-dependent hydrolase (beta-lactamase superfamily II)
MRAEDRFGGATRSSDDPRSVLLPAIWRAARRALWAGLLATIALGWYGQALAAAPKAGSQVSGFFRTQIGDFEVTSLTDGAFAMPPGLMKADQDQVMQLIAHDFPSDPPKFDASVAGFLVNTGRQLILVDTGFGHFGDNPGTGKLASNLRAAGYRPEQVDLVLLTHLHLDHIGGLLTKDGKRAFPNAVVRMAQAESDFWLSRQQADASPKQMQFLFRDAREAAAPYQAAGRWKPFTGTDELAPGVRPYPLVGHTPGHSGYEFSSKGERLLAWGDTLHMAPVQFPHPEIGIAFDRDSDQAIEQREKLFDSLADDRTVVVAAAHVGFPSLGRLLRQDSGYAWVPVRYASAPR